MTATALASETLDPDDWESFARTAHALLDELIAFQREVRERPVWRAVPEEVERELAAPLPRQGTPLDAVLADVRRLILPYPLGNPHPRFWGWVMGNGTPDSMLAEAIASTMDPNMGGADHVAHRVERVALSWLREMLGWPADASGLFVSGGSLANLTAMTVARHVKAGFDVRAEGLAGRPQLVAYVSEEAHSSNERSLEILGIGSRHVRKVPVDGHFSMDVHKLRAAVRADREAGLRPFLVIGTAGTTNTGAIDPLDAIADVARDEELWFHLDGAFGALAWLAPDLRPRLAGLPRADSIAFDLHKWGWLPFDCGVVMVKDAKSHLAAFTVHPPYLAHETRGAAAQHGDMPWCGDLGVELSRGFRGLKAYVALRTHGADKWGRIVAQNVALARRLAARVEATPGFELLSPTTLNIVCFRVRPDGLAEPEVDALNKEIVLRIQESGFAVPTGTSVRGRYAIRCNFTNHRTTPEDVDAFVEVVARTAKELDARA